MDADGLLLAAEDPPSVLPARQWAVLFGLPGAECAFWNVVVAVYGDCGERAADHLGLASGVHAGRRGVGQFVPDHQCHLRGGAAVQAEAGEVREGDRSGE